MRSKIFLSYAHEDADSSRLIYRFLSAMDLNVWMDEFDLRPGIDLRLAIEKEIEHSDYVIALLSNCSVNKYGYVQKELRTAMEELEKYPEDRIYLVPVRLDDCEVPHSLRRKVWVDFGQPRSMIRLLKAFTDSVDLDYVHRKMREAELFSPKHNPGRIAYRNGDYVTAERLAREAYDEIPNPHSKLNEMVAVYAQRKIIKRQLDEWVYKLRLQDSGHGQSVFAKGY